MFLQREKWWRLVDHVFGCLIFFLRFTILLALMVMLSSTKMICPKNFPSLCATRHPLISRSTYPNRDFLEIFQ